MIRFVYLIVFLVLGLGPASSSSEQVVDQEENLNMEVDEEEFDFPPDPPVDGLENACADELKASMASLLALFSGEMSSVASSVVFVGGGNEINRLRSIGCADAGARVGNFMLDAYERNEADPIMGHADPFWQRVAFPAANALAESGDIQNAIELFSEIENPAPSEFSSALAQNLGIIVPNGLEPGDKFFAARQLGYLHLESGDNAQARKSFARAERLRDKIEDRSDDVDHADIIRLEMQKSNYSGAVERLNQRRTSLASVLGDKHPEYIDQTVLLLEAYFLGGEAFAAEKLVGETLHYWETVFGRNDARTLQLLDKLSALLVYHGRYAEAERVSLDVLVRHEAAAVSDSYEHAARLSVLGEAQEGLGKLVAAEDSYRKAISIFDSLSEGSFILSPAQPEKQARLGIVRVLQKSGRANEATEFLRDVFTNASDMQLSGFRARILAGQGVDEEWLNVTMRLAKAQGVTGSPRYIEAMVWTGEWYRREGKIDKASDFVLEAVNTYAELLLAGATPGSASDQRLWQRLSDELLRITLRVGFEKEANDAKIGSKLREAAFLASQFSENVSSQAVTAATARLAASDAGYADIITQLETAQRTLRALEAYMALASSRTSDSDERATALRVLGERRARIAAEIEQIRDRISDQFPQFLELVLPSIVSLADLSDAGSGLLGPDEGLVVLVPPLKDAMGAVLAVTHAGVEWASINVPWENFETDIEMLRSPIQAEMARNLVPTDSGSQYLPGYFNYAAAHRLYEVLFGSQNIAELLGQKADWVLAPQGSLLSLPFSTLKTSADPEDKTSWLGLQRSLAVVPAISSLRTMRLTRRPVLDAIDRTAFLGIGAPNFLGAPDKLRRPEPTEALFSGGVGLVEQVRSLPALPHTRREILEIANTFNLSEEKMLLEGLANESRVFQLSEEGRLDDFNIVLFATHALVSGDFIGLTEPALALTPPLDGPRIISEAADVGAGGDVSLGTAVIAGARIDDGLLTMSEVSTLRMDAEWVILSACSTASAENSTAHGLSGLARAFFFAGARTLLVSHWPVDDRMAADLTTRLVSLRAISGNQRPTKAQALKLAMNEIVQNAKGKEIHPAFWAPFQIVGVDPL